MSEVQYCHEIDEFENSPLKDEVFNFDSRKMNIEKFNSLKQIGNCNQFLPLNEKEMAMFAENKIDGDSLRKIGENEFVNTFFNIKYSFNQNGKLMKTYHY